MSNIKKVLSLMLAAAMMLGMMLVPTSAAQFKDANEITYTEEVAITAGLGLFAGADGKFMPKDTVTRAQMATIIVKMLHGADANADTFKGANGGFTDTASFEGGWAEGYINWCASLGIVKGYGDGTFKPGNKVTAAEAVTMILNALKIDAGEGTWPVTVMAKAEEVKFFEDLKQKPTSDKAMSREELAVVSLAGMEYSPEGKTGYLYNGVVYESFMDALLIAGDASKVEPAANDTLATKVYELKTAEGFIVANQDTGYEYTELSGGRLFDIETGLDQIGHYVTVYYKEAYESEEKPGVTYAVSDECTVVKVAEAIDTAKEYKAAFGKTYSKNTGITMIDGEYNVSDVTGSIAGYDGGSAAPEGTYIIHKGNIVSYMEPVARYASYIAAINTYEGEESVLINGATEDGSYIPNNELDDQLMEYTGMVEGDFVTYVKAQDIYFLELVNPIKGKITRTTKVEVNGELRDVVTISGAEFVAFAGESKLGTKLSTNLANINYGETYELYITDDDQFIGFKAGEKMNVSDVVYVVGSGTVNTKDNYGKPIVSAVARCVDMEGKELRVVVGITKDGETLGTDVLPTSGFYFVKDSTDKDAKQEGIQVLTRLPKSYDGQGGVFAVTSSGADQSFYSSGYRHLKTSDGKQTYGKTGSKYMVVDGDMASLELDVDILTTLTAFDGTASQKYDILVTRSEDGTSNYIEVMVITGMSSAEVASGTGAPLYITAEQIDNGSRTADGYTYEAYNAEDGTLMEILVEEDAAIAPGQDGFYSMTKDDEFALLTKLDHNASITDAYVRQNQGFMGMYSNREVKSLNTGLTLPYNSSASAKVVDVRSEEQIQADKIARIASTAQLVDLVQNNDGLLVLTDLFVNKQSGSDPKVGSIFITSITRNTPGLQSILYAFEAPATTGEDVKMALVRNDRGTATGELISVSWENALNATDAGFYRYSVDPDGKPTLEAVAVNNTAVGYPGTMGVHNSVEALDVDAMTITTADGFTMCGSDMPCTHVNEAFVGQLQLTADTVIYDQEGNKITLAALEQLMLANEDYKVLVNYFCADAVHNGEGAADNTPEAVFVCGLAEVVPPHEHNCGHDHATGDWKPFNSVVAGTGGSAAIPEGNYYLTDDLTVDVQLNITGTVSLCLNGHTLTRENVPGGNPAWIFRFNADNTVLNICDCSEGANGSIGKDWPSKSNAVTDAVIIVRGANSTLNMYAGSISGATAPSVIYLAAATNTFNMYGGKITGNTMVNYQGSNSYMGAVMNKGTVNIYEGAEIRGNDYQNGATSEITGAGTVNNNGGIVGDEPVVPPVTEAHTHNCSHTHAVTTGEWIDLNTLVTAGTNTNVSAGRYYLSGDLVLNSGTNTAGQLNFTGNVLLCLNGYTITSGSKQANVFRTDGTVTVDICDCVGTGKVTGHAATGTTNSVFIARNGGTYNIYGGNFTGNSGKSLMYVADGNVKVNIYGGNFEGNRTEADVYFAKDGATAGTAQVTLYGGAPTLASTANTMYYGLVLSGGQYTLMQGANKDLP